MVAAAAPSCRSSSLQWVGMRVTLRMLEDADLDQVFKWERDPSAVAMAAFTRADPSDRVAFDRHYERVAEHNIGSAKVLARAGFVQVGSETAHADGVGRDLVEHIYRLDE